MSPAIFKVSSVSLQQHRRRHRPGTANCLSHTYSSSMGGWVIPLCLCDVPLMERERLGPAAYRLH